MTESPLVFGAESSQAGRPAWSWNRGGFKFSRPGQVFFGLPGETAEGKIGCGLYGSSRESPFPRRFPRASVESTAYLPPLSPFLREAPGLGPRSGISRNHSTRRNSVPISIRLMPTARRGAAGLGGIAAGLRGPRARVFLGAHPTCVRTMRAHVLACTRR